MEEDYNRKRINPPIWQHDYHVLKRLYKSLQIIADKYIDKKVDVILDYGCGSMPYKNLFLPRASKYIGVDIGRNKKADILVKENQKIPLKDGSVDIVISTQVLEHVGSVDFYLKQCHRLLKRNGFLILSTHGIWPYHLYPGDYHRWTKEGLAREIEKTEFKCLDLYSILGPMASATQFELVLVSEKMQGKGFLIRLFLATISFLTNVLIWIEDRVFPSTENSDSSLYLICAQKM